MKTIFLDADGTLFSAKGYIPDSAIAAVKKAQKNGHQIVLCTGRQKTEIYSDMQKIHYDAMIVGSGSCIVVHDKVVYDEGFSQKDKEFLIDYLYSHQIPAVFETTDHLYATKEIDKPMQHLVDIWCKDLTPEKKAQHGLTLMIQQIIKVKRSKLYQLPINKVSFISSDTPFEQMRKDLKEHFLLVRATFEPFGKEGGEIMGRNHTKGTGIQAIQQFMHLNNQDFISIGDGHNDFEMFEACPYNVAMGNACPSLKEKADHITTDIDDNGIYNAFKFLHLI